MSEAAPPVAAVLQGRARDLGGLSLRRVLPQLTHRAIGPFVFLDHFGPAMVGPGQSMEVPPHPHIGLATVSWLYEGAVMHRDSLGSEQRIDPGAINWMVAGRGIVHSERTPARLKRTRHRTHGLQLWVALPQGYEETEPLFEHHPARTLPELRKAGVTLRVLLGTAYGQRAPATTFSPMFYVDVSLKAGASHRVTDEHPERGLYLVEGALTCAGERYTAGQLLVLTPGGSPEVRAEEACRFVLIGGAPLDGPRLMWWNFVSSSRRRLEEAKRAWKTQSFPLVPGDEDRFTPLPDEAPHIEPVPSFDGGEFVLYQQGEVLGELTWKRVNQTVMLITHTGVRESQRGKGQARRLVMHAVAWAREHRVKIAPRCPYARKVITEDTDLHDVLAPAWQTLVG